MTDTNNTKNTDTTQEDDNSFEKRIQTMSLEQLEEEKKKTKFVFSNRFKYIQSIQ